MIDLPEDVDEMVEEIDNFATHLNDWEKKFISDMIDNKPSEYTLKQIDKIQQIYDGQF